MGAETTEQSKGISRGQGRKPKAKEEEIKNFALGSMKRAFGSEKKAWEALANMSKDSFPHLRLLWEYKYGKPKEQKDLNVKQEVNIPVISFLDPEKTIDIDAEHKTMAKKIKNSYSPFFSEKKGFDCEYEIGRDRCEEQCSFCSVIPITDE